MVGGGGGFCYADGEGVLDTGCVGVVVVRE